MRELVEHVTTSTKVAHSAHLSAPVASAVAATATATATVLAQPAIPAPATAPTGGVDLEARLEAGLDIPSLEELQDACVLVSEHLALCAEPTRAADDDTCAVDEQFSDMYGKPVYLCRT